MSAVNTKSFYSTTSNHDNSLFDDENIQRYDANTIKHRYGNNWRNFASNVREITQPDGSIIKEYIIEDPTLLEHIKPSFSSVDSTNSDDEQQEPLKDRFTQIKAKFEQKPISTVMVSPLGSSSQISHIATHESTRKQIDELYARHRRASNGSISTERINNSDNNNIKYASGQYNDTQDNYQRSQSTGTENSKSSSFRRFESADEADEEVQRIHRQGEELRRHKEQVASVLPANEISQQSRTHYEITDEDGNPLVIDSIQDLIKMSGAHAREVPQPDGTIVKEYVIDDPQLISKYRSQQQQQQQQQQLLTTSSNTKQSNNKKESPPPPPPRIPLRSSVLLRQELSSTNDNLSYNIQQIHVLEPQRRYEYLTRTGRRIQFLITNSNSYNGALISDSDIRELTHAINSRITPSSSTSTQYQQKQYEQQLVTKTSFNLPKQWNPSIDYTPRERIGSDTQLYSGKANSTIRQIQTDSSRSASYGGMNQDLHHTKNYQQVSNDPGNNWDTYQDQDFQNHTIDQHHNDTKTFQTSSQFLPAKPITRSMHSPTNNNGNATVFYQQAAPYPYQGQQQHGVRILNDFNQPRTPTIFN